MTPPLPAQNSKPAIGESKNSQQGGFLNFCAPQKKGETPSFESLISKNEDHQESQDQLEEAETAKKRRKQIDAAAIAAPVTNDSPLGLTADLEKPLGLDQSQDKSSAKPGNLNETLNPHASGKLISSDAKSDTNEVANGDSNELKRKEPLERSELPESSKLKVSDRAVSRDETPQSPGTDNKEAAVRSVSSSAQLQRTSDGTKPAATENDKGSLLSSEAPTPAPTAFQAATELATEDASGLDAVGSPVGSALPESSKLKVSDRAVSRDETPQSPGTDNKEAVGRSVSTSAQLQRASDGTKPAEKKGEMVSLSTFEDIQAISAPKAEGQSSITSADRAATLSPFSEQSAIKSTGGADSDSDESPENFLAANSSPSQFDLGTGSHKAAATQASSVFKTLAPELEKFQQSGQSQVQLELPLSDTESVKIRLSLRGGEIHSTFITQSPELRDALQKAWPDFTATHRDQGLRFGESQFQDSFARNQDAASEQGRQRQAQMPGEENHSKPHTKSPARISSSSQSDRASSSRLNLWA